MLREQRFSLIGDFQDETVKFLQTQKTLVDKAFGVLNYQYGWSQTRLSKPNKFFYISRKEDTLVSRLNLPFYREKIRWKHPLALTNNSFTG
jgi:hypothetical protein